MVLRDGQYVSGSDVMLSVQVRGGQGGSAAARCTRPYGMCQTWRRPG